MRITLPREDRLALHDGTGHAIAKPINDLLGLRDDDRYPDWLEEQWGELAPTRASIAVMVGAASRGNPEAHLRDALADVAVKASDEGGTINYTRLAPLLGQVRRFSGGEIEVPSLAVLAAWALTREVERGVDVLIQCPSCQRPWFARGTRTATTFALDRSEPVNEFGLLDAYNCPRPAPGLTMTCAQLYSQDRFARERGEWSKEYRKVMARKLRGSVPEEEFRAWKSVSGPGERGKDWIPFDEWRAHRA